MKPLTSMNPGSRAVDRATHPIALLASTEKIDLHLIDHPGAPSAIYR